MKRRLLGTGCAVGIACALLASVFARAALARPSLHIEAADVSVAAEPGRRSADVVFEVRNGGRADLVIERVTAEAQCCSRVLQFPAKLAPGGAGKIVVQLDVGQFGQSKVPFRLVTNDPVQEDAFLYASVSPTRRPPFVVAPAPPAVLDWGRVWRKGQSLAFLVRTAELPDEDPWITQVGCDDRRVRCVLERSARPRRLAAVEFVDYEYTLDLVEVPPSGPFRAKVILWTKSGFEQIPLVAEVVAPVQMIPSVLFVSEVGAEYFIDLMHREGIPFTAALVAVTPSPLQVQRVTDAAADRLRSAVRLSPESHPAVNKGAISFRVSDAVSTQNVELPVWLHLPRTEPGGH